VPVALAYLHNASPSAPYAPVVRFYLVFFLVCMTLASCSIRLLKMHIVPQACRKDSVPLHRAWR